MKKECLTERDDIFVIKGFFSDEDCDKTVALAESIGFGDAPVSGPGGAIINKRMRDNERVIHDSPGLAAEIWPKLHPFVSELKTAVWTPVGLNERFRFYRYEKEQFFDWHFDGAYQRSGREASRLTVLIYLSDGFTGGTTDFCFKAGVLRDDDPIVTVVPEKGMALVFTHNVLHRGAPVTSGRKYVLRSDVMFRMLG